MPLDTSTTPSIVIAYVPVIHQGYLRFFANQPVETAIGVLTSELTQSYEPLQKDIRSLSPQQIVTSLQALLPERQIQLVTATDLIAYNTSSTTILMPDEDISRQVAEEHLAQAQIEFGSIFLRWDKSRTTQLTPPTPVATITLSELKTRFMQQAQNLSQKSADWWRQVGAVLVKDGQPIMEAVNHHLPHQQQAYIVGDPRANFHKREQIELSTAIHAEASLIAQAAQRGISVAGAQLYVTTFPCPVCAKLIAESGIAEVYYSQGYAMLDGEEILAARNVTVIAVAPDLSPV